MANLRNQCYHPHPGAPSKAPRAVVSSNKREQCPHWQIQVRLMSGPVDFPQLSGVERDSLAGLQDV